MNILLKSAKIFDKKSTFHKQIKDILIEEGIIIKIADNIECPKNCKVINIENLQVSNGWFDSSVSFGEPGYEERENLSNGLDTAAKSGFTAVAVNSNTNPYLDTKSSIAYLKTLASNKATSLYPIASLTQKSAGKEIAELYDMKSAGAVAFGDYNKPIDNDNLMKIALLYAQNFDGLVLSFPLNTEIGGEGIAHEGINSTLLGLKGIPSLAEEMQIARDLFLLEYTGGKLHIPTISTANSVELIREAKKKNLAVTCSVTTHHLTLTDQELKKFDGNTKVLPPLRTDDDRLALIEGVKDGTIDCITSDHNPIDIENKKVEFSNAEYGTIGLENMFGSLKTILDTETIIEALTEKPKAIFGIENSNITEGATANLSFFTEKGKTIFSEENILSTSKNSIFLQKEVAGKSIGVYANKQLILNN
ncbi:dihydroorotase [Flavicella marina]|uniref:dihydroorotase n=1 Tax=Flavicella marina TaxID=1475951 RepID=UPI0012651E34|nr:dihydroorotase [Flavicella marina]